MNELESVEYRGRKIGIYYDESAENPITEWDGNLEFCCWHRNYDLGNSERFGNRLEGPEECRDYAKRTRSILLPLYMYEHGGIALSLGRKYPFNCRWDSGQVGCILIDREWLNANFGKRYFTKKMRVELLEMAESNVRLYNDYLSGAVYGYMIEDGDDSCWGFYGYDHEKSGLLEMARDNIDYTIEQNKKDHFAQLKQWIKNRVPLQYRKPLAV